MVVVGVVILVGGVGDRPSGRTADCTAAARSTPPYAYSGGRTDDGGEVEVSLCIFCVVLVGMENHRSPRQKCK